MFQRPGGERRHRRGRGAQGERAAKCRSFLGGTRRRARILRRGHTVPAQTARCTRCDHRQQLLLSAGKNRRRRCVAGDGCQTDAPRSRTKRLHCTGSTSSGRAVPGRRMDWSAPWPPLPLSTATARRRHSTFCEKCPFAHECLHKDVKQPTTMAALLDLGALLWPERHRYLADTLWSNSPPEEILATARDHFLQAPSPKSLGVCVFTTG